MTDPTNSALAEAVARLLDECRTDEGSIAEVIKIQPNGEAEVNVAWAWGFGSKRNFTMLEFPAALRLRSEDPALQPELDLRSDR